MDGNGDGDDFDHVSSADLLRQINGAKGGGKHGRSVEPESSEDLDDSDAERRRRRRNKGKGRA